MLDAVLSQDWVEGNMEQLKYIRNLRFGGGEELNPVYPLHYLSFSYHGKISQSLWRRMLRQREGICREVTSHENFKISLPKHKSNGLTSEGKLQGNRWVETDEVERTLDQETETKFNSTFTICFQFYLEQILSLF